MINSPIFDAKTGFGGNGAYVPGWHGFNNELSFEPGAGGGCIQDGPFKNYNLSIGPGLAVTDHCLVRAVNNLGNAYVTAAKQAYTLTMTSFEDFRQEAGGAFKPPPYKLHDGGHVGVNGEMGNVFSSPGGEDKFLL